MPKRTIITLIVFGLAAAALLPRLGLALDCVESNSGSLTLVEVTEDGAPVVDLSAYQGARVELTARASGEVEIFARPQGERSAFWSETYRAPGTAGR